MQARSSSQLTLLERLRSPEPYYCAELRPPRADLDGTQGIDAWIDLQHGLRTLSRRGHGILLTDNAVGTREEENLRHLCANSDESVERHQLVPILTCLHSLEYCLNYAARAQAAGFTALAVLGGDPQAGIERCTPHAYELRSLIRGQTPGLALGGWANPHKNVERQLEFLLDRSAQVDFYLTQVVSGSQMQVVESFLRLAAARGLGLPGVFGVFHYRSANRRTLKTLSSFLPVPVDEVRQALESGCTPVQLTARSIAQLLELGVRNIYVSNLPAHHPAKTLDAILRAVARLRA